MLSPEAVAAEVRARVVDELQRLNFTPAVEGFAARIEKFAGALALWGSRMNLTAHPDDPAEIAFHVIDSLMPAVIAACPEGTFLRSAFGRGKRILDIGSGAGFPGLVLATASEASFTLTESRRRRASFLAVTAAEMGLANVTVEAQRAQPSQFPTEFHVVIARAVGDLVGFFSVAASALLQGGIALLYASASQRLALAEARRLGLGDYTRYRYEVARGAQRVSRVAVVWRRL